MRARRSIVLAAGIAFGVGSAAPAHADIAPPPPPHVLYPQAEVVLTGSVASVGTESVRVTVDEVLKGRPGATIEVGPIFEPTCCPVPEGKLKPFFSVGQRVLVAARAGKERWQFVDHTLWTTRMDDAHPNAWTGSVAVAREMLRIAALPTAEERRAAMVVHLRSESNRFVDAAVWFQFAELHTPEESGPHVAGLVAALQAPLVEGRKAAARALRGLTPAEAVAPLIASSKSADMHEAQEACATLAPYDRKDAVEAVIAAKYLRFLGASPRPEAYAVMLERLRRPETDAHREAYAAFGERFRRQVPTDAEVDEFVEILRRGAVPTEGYAITDVLLPMRSPRLDRALVELLRVETIAAWQRNAAYRTLWEHAERGAREDVAALLRENESLFVARIDAGDDQMHLVWILKFLHTETSRRALARAADRDPPDRRGDARRALDSWDER